MSLKRCSIALAVGVFTLLLVGRALSQAANEDVGELKQPERITSRVYDIRDLLMQIRQYPARSALVPPTRIGERYPARPVEGRATTSPAGGGDAPYTREQLVDMFLTLIRETVDPDSWRDNGGTLGAIREIQGQLIVTQSEENQRQLAELLRQLRETSAKMVTVRADWVFLSPADLRRLAKPLPGDPSLLAVDRAALDKLLADGAASGFNGQVTGFNAQTVHIASGPARTVVSEQTPVVGGGDNTAAYEPVASVVQAGLLLEVTPVLTPDASSVMLDVQSVASDWKSPSARPATRPATFPQALGVAPPEVDRVEMMVQQLRTSVALPTGRPVVIGGMSWDVKVPQSKDARTELVLVIEVNGSRGEAAPVLPPAGGGKPILD